MLVVASVVDDTTTAAGSAATSSGPGTSPVSPPRPATQNTPPTTAITANTIAPMSTADRPPPVPPRLAASLEYLGLRSTIGGDGGATCDTTGEGMTGAGMIGDEEDARIEDCDGEDCNGEDCDGITVVSSRSESSGPPPPEPTAAETTFGDAERDGAANSVRAVVATVEAGATEADGDATVDTAPAPWPAAIAAPNATVCFGCWSTAMGRPNSAPTISATNGICDEPPTSSTAAKSFTSTDALRTARRNASTVCCNNGRIIASNSARVNRTSVCTFGRTTGMATSVSADNASLAATHS